MAINSFTELAPDYSVSRDLYVPLNENPFERFRFNTQRFSRGWGEKLRLSLFPTVVEYDVEIINLPSTLTESAWRGVKRRSAISFTTEPSSEELKRFGLERDDEGYFFRDADAVSYLKKEQARLSAERFFTHLREGRQSELTELEKKIARWNPNEGILRRKIDCMFGSEPDEKINPIIAEVTGEYLFAVPSIRGLTLSFAPEMNTEKPFVGFRRYMGLDWYESKTGWERQFGESPIAEGIRETQQILDKVQEIIF